VPYHFANAQFSGVSLIQRAANGRHTGPVRVCQQRDWTSDAAARSGLSPYARDDRRSRRNRLRGAATNAVCRPAAVDVLPVDEDGRRRPDPQVLWCS
jgi:hypothetical protein